MRLANPHGCHISIVPETGRNIRSLRDKGILVSMTWYGMAFSCALLCYINNIVMWVCLCQTPLQKLTFSLLG